MNYFSIDYLIVYAFLGITMSIGIRAGKGIKDVRDYILANKTFGKWAILLSYLATAISGGAVLSTVEQVYAEGIIKVFSILSYSIMFTLTGFFILPKLASFKNCLTLGDLTATFYGETSGIIAGILGFITAVCRAAIDLIVLGIICETLLGIKASWGIIAGSIILGIYSAHGGIRSVTSMDVFQFLVLFVILPMIVYITFNKAGGIEFVFNHLPQSKIQVFGHKKFTYYLTYCLISALCPLCIASNPAIVQRFLMARNGKELKEQRLLAAVFIPIVGIIFTLIGLAGFLLYPNIEAKNLLSHVIQVLLPTGLKGLAIAGLLAVMMSTIDAYLHAAGFTIIHDVMKPILNKRNIQINELQSIKWATILVSSIAIIMGLVNNDIYQLLIIPVGFSGPLLMFPIISSIMGLKSDQKNFYIALIVTAITFTLCRLFLTSEQDHLVVLFSILANGITFFGIHIIKNKGFVIIDRFAGKESLWRPRKKPFIATLKKLAFTSIQITQYFKEKAEQCGEPYVAFGILLTLNYIIPYSLWTNVSPQFQHIILILRLVGGTLCVLLIVREKWPNTLVRYLPIFWYFTILFCMPFTNTVMYLLSKGSTEWLISFLGFTVVLYILFDWISVLVIVILGMSLGILCGKVLDVEINFSLNFIDKYLLLYQIIFGWILSITFLHTKQLVFNRLSSQRDYFKYIRKDTNSRLAEILKYREELLKELDAQQIAIFDDVTAAYIKQAIYRITDYLRLDVKTIILDDFLEKVEDISKLHDFTPHAEIHMQHLTKIKEIQADESKLYQVLVNSISYIHEHNQNSKPIRIVLEEALIGHTIAHMKDYTKKLEALKVTITTEETLPARQDIYMIDSNKPIDCLAYNYEGKLLLLVENARIIEAHYGYINVQLSHTHTYVIPINLRKIRGKVMELLRQPAQADPDEIKHPLAIELEKKLLDNIKDTQIKTDVIHKALNIIKKYHGGVKRKSGEPFFTHPIAVALILLEHIQDQDAVVGALLHDTVEDTSLSITQIKALFGNSVAFIVSKVTNLEDNFRRISLDDHENLHRLRNYEDERVALVKLSDRLHNMRTIQHHPSLTKQKNIANETLTFFVPMAKELNRLNMAEELEKLCVAVLNKEE
jgi:Na+/proline symporter